MVHFRYHPLKKALLSNCVWICSISVPNHNHPSFSDPFQTFTYYVISLPSVRVRFLLLIHSPILLSHIDIHRLNYPTSLLLSVFILYLPFHQPSTTPTTRCPTTVIVFRSVVLTLSHVTCVTSGVSIDGHGLILLQAQTPSQKIVSRKDRPEFPSDFKTPNSQFRVTKSPSSFP